MNRAEQLITIAEAVLKMAKVDYKNNPHGVVAYDDLSKDWGYKAFKKNHHTNQEVHNTLPIHDELSKEAKSQFGEDPKGEKQDAVREYTHSEYTSMNGHLRHQNYVSNENRLRIGHLKTLTKNKTKHSFVVYRSNSSKVIPETQGEHFKDHGFTSSTLRPSFGVDNFGIESGSQHFVIHVKKGTKGHYVSAHSFSNGEGHEKEFLFHPGTTFRVGKTQKHANGNTYVHLHVHSQEADSHPDDFAVPKPLDIDADSPNEHHKFVLNHYKNHEYYGDQSLEKKHKKLLSLSPEAVKSEADQIKLNNPYKYGEKFNIDKVSPNADHKFVLNHYKNHLGYDDESLASKHKDLLNYPDDAAYDKKNIIKGNPNLYKNERSLDIEKDSPDEDHKFILHHMKHHLNMSDDIVKSIHKSLLDNTPEQKKASVGVIKSQNSALYGSEWGEPGSMKLKKPTSAEDEHEANHKLVVANAKKHGMDDEDVKTLSHIFNKAKNKPHLSHYKNILAAAKAGQHPYGDLDDD